MKAGAIHEGGAIHLRPVQIIKEGTFTKTSAQMHLPTSPELPFELPCP
jgi:hypothetical protein